MVNGHPDAAGGDAAETVPVYRGNDLAPGARIDGSSIVEEATTTVLVPQDSSAVVDALGDYRMTLG